MSVQVIENITNVRTLSEIFPDWEVLGRYDANGKWFPSMNHFGWQTVNDMPVYPMSNMFVRVNKRNITFKNNYVYVTQTTKEYSLPNFEL